MVKSGDIQLFDVRSHKEVEETGMMPDSIHLPCMANNNPSSFA